MAAKFARSVKKKAVEVRGESGKAKIAIYWAASCGGCEIAFS